MACAEGCYARALEVAGRDVTAEDVIAEVEKDRVFYEESGGGMTLSGGEPLYQYEFARSILDGARCGVPPSLDMLRCSRLDGSSPDSFECSQGERIEKRPLLHSCIETCGFGPPGNFLDIVPLVDLFLWDIKDTDEARHETNTGVPLLPILENLRLVDKAGGVTILRCLLIDGVNLNEEHLDRLAEIYRSLRDCRGIELLRYHALGDSKYARLGIPCTTDSLREPTPEQMESAKGYLHDRHGIDVL
jgi:pyruvate formate lyase activating enzyme